MLKRAFFYILVLFLMVPFVGCSSVQKQPTNSKDVSQASNSNIDNVKTPEETYKQLFGDVKIKIVRAQLSDGRPWTEMAISDKGEIFGFAPKNNGKPGELIIYNLNTGATQSIYSAKDDAMPTFFKYNDNYLAWTETSSNSDQSISRIIVYDRKEKKSTVLSEKTNMSSSISYEMIALGSDYVLWSTGDMEKDNVNYRIMKNDLKTQTTTVFKENATMPIIGKEFIAWLGPEDEQKKYSAIYFNDLKDNTIKKITTEGQHPTYINTDGTSIVFDGVVETNTSSSMPSAKMLSIYENGKVQIIKKSDTDNFEYPEISQNFVGWRGTDALRVYSRKDAKIGILTEEYADYTEVKISDKYIMWHSPAIKDENEAKLKAMEQNIYLSDLHIISKDDIHK